MTAAELTLPLPIGSIDLETRAKELGIKYFLPTVYTLNSSVKGPIVPVSAIKKVQQYGFHLHGFLDYNTGGSMPECFMLPDPRTLIQLPWKPEFGWLAW